MKKFILSIIVFLCVYPVAKANNSNVKIKFIGEFEKSSQGPFIVTQKSLRGLGFELYHKLRETPFVPIHRQRKWKLDLGSKYIRWSNN